MMTYVLTVIISLFMGWISRIVGGATPKLPGRTAAYLYCIPYALLALKYPLSPHLYFIIPAMFLNYAFAILGKRTGHGQYIDLGKWNIPWPSEKLDFIVSLFFGVDDFHNKYRDEFGLFVTGAFCTLGSVITLCLAGHFLIALAVFVGGGMKALAYIIGDKVKLKINQLRDPTEVGEFLTGVFGHYPVILALIL